MKIFSIKMSVKTLGEVAESYFQTLNPIAERISTDIESIRDAYEGLWSSLSNREKEQIINETVIYPEAILKYTLGSQSHEFPSLNTREITGAKFVIDEQTVSFFFFKVHAKLPLLFLIT